ncbi:MAG: ABC transporter permease [Puniceicoccales bacterium]|jgi:lipoprotein-releasing system permease protein|nr:ABC transporter permease [Puniceicoccales bacterium]
MKWYVYLALKQLFPTGKRISFFAAMSIVGVALGVVVLFVVQSVMEGFQYNIKKMIVDTQGDVRVDSKHMIFDVDKLEDFLRNFPGVAAVARYAYGMMMLKYDDRTGFPTIKGVDIENEAKVIDLRKFIKQGNLENFNCGGIVLNDEMARSVGATVGSSVEVFSPKIVEETSSGEIILQRTFDVSAIYETGYQNVAMIAIDTLQDLYGLGEGVHGFSLRLVPGVMPEKVAFELNKDLPKEIVAMSWQEMNKGLMFALQTEKAMMSLVLMFVLLIAAFSIAGSLLASVIRKTREIGLFSALGGTVWQCAMCFVLQGAIIGIIGSFIGIIVGMVTLKFRNIIMVGFLRLCGVEDFMMKFYSFANMPSRYGKGDVLTLVAFAVFLCCLAGVLPALKVAKINPAEALRNE